MVLAVQVDLQAVAVGGDHRRGTRRRPVVPEERGDDHRRGRRVGLGPVDGGAGLRHPEHVGDTRRLHRAPAPDPFPGVAGRRRPRVVVEAAPGDQARVPGVGPRLVVGEGVRVRLAGQHGRRVGPAEGGQDRPHRLAHQVRHPGDGRREAGLPVDHVVVVVAEDVLGPARRRLGRHRAAGLPGAVEGIGDLTGPRVQRGIVLRLVEPRAPHDDRGTVPVADHHVADVGQHLALERGVPHEPPARRFLPDHDAQLVTGVQEVRRLGIVRAADHVDVELVLEDLRVPAL